MMDFFGLAVRISIVYLYTLAFLRLSGKRSIGNITAFDFLVALIIGDLFDDIILSEVSVPNGLVAIGVIILWHALVSVASYASPRIHDLVSSQPTRIITNGEFLQDSLRKERLPREEVYRALRIADHESPEPIRQSFLETNGGISLLLKEPSKEVQKKDLPRLKDLF